MKEGRKRLNAAYIPDNKRCRRDPVGSKIDVGLCLAAATWLANESQKLCHSKVSLHGEQNQSAPML